MDPDPYPVPDPDPTPGPTPIFNDFEDVKNINFFPIFSYNLPTGTSSSVLKIFFFVKILCYNSILSSIISVRSRHL
jgi:hypothetical protein